MWHSTGAHSSEILVTTRHVLLVCALLLTTAGCSQGGRPISLGFNETLGLGSAPQTVQASLGDQPALANQANGGPQARLASVAGPEPRPESPSSGAMDPPSRDLDTTKYARTRLDVDSARKLINAYRRENGLQPLAINPQLTKAAKSHSQDLAKWDRISHFGSDGSNPWDRVKRTGYKASLAAENVGTGQGTIEEVMDGWKKSPGHNKNLLLQDANEMGIALVHAPRTEFKTFWTLVLGSRL
ncbi:MAG: CAP domain-containing protein [Hyphomicrobiaceae bacterium]